MLITKFHPFPELVTERLLLRQVHVSDAKEIFFLRSDKNVLQFIAKEPAKSVEEVKTFIKTIAQSNKDGESVLWGIALRNNPAILIGSIGFWRMQKENYRSEIGYVLHPQQWNKGIMKEAMAKVLEYGFAKMKLHSVEARIDPGNQASEAVLKSAGFIKEGYFRQDYFFNGKFLDTVVYSKLKK